jgi:hypothetical protein
MFPELAALICMSKEYAQRAHWGALSHSQHVTLGDFYDGLIPLLDSLVEMYQGRTRTRVSLPSCDLSVGDAVTVLSTHLEIIEGTRYQAIAQEDTPLQNKIDEVCGLYLSTINKLINYP